jgi:hypothetical protein
VDVFDAGVGVELADAAEWLGLDAGWLGSV